MKLLKIREDMANIFQQQFSLVFSDPSSKDIRVAKFQAPEVTHEM